MKTIYIMLSRSETMVSKIIGVLSEGDYTHVSIAFEENLRPMYSFARRGTLPLPAGLRLEYADRGYYKDHRHIPCALYKLRVSDETYKSAKVLVKKMMDELDNYSYNVIGLFMYMLNVDWRRNHHFTCSQFVSEVLNRSNAVKLPKPVSLMRPNDYTLLPELELCFKGDMCGLAEFCSA